MARQGDPEKKVLGKLFPTLLWGPLWSSFHTEVVPSMTLFGLKLEIVLWAKVHGFHVHLSGKVPNLPGPPSVPLGLTQPPSHAGLFASMESALGSH